ncbi:hypothetical protein B0H14DRAFT_3718382 [Mycena olivaceomarginata]|nr:hypothetical protein B0H14DRAFT_3718382 [Mycena olivaceomarginata]
MLPHFRKLQEAILGTHGYKAHENYDPIWRHIRVPEAFSCVRMQRAFWKRLKCAAAIYQVQPKSALFKLPALQNPDVRKWMSEVFPVDLKRLKDSEKSHLISQEFRTNHCDYLLKSLMSCQPKFQTLKHFPSHNPMTITFYHLVYHGTHENSADEATPDASDIAIGGGACDTAARKIIGPGCDEKDCQAPGFEEKRAAFKRNYHKSSKENDLEAGLDESGKRSHKKGKRASLKHKGSRKRKERRKIQEAVADPSSTSYKDVTNEYLERLLKILTELRPNGGETDTEAGSEAESEGGGDEEEDASSSAECHLQHTVGSSNDDSGSEDADEQHW